MEDGGWRTASNGNDDRDKQAHEVSRVNLVEFKEAEELVREIENDQKEGDQKQPHDSGKLVDVTARSPRSGQNRQESACAEKRESRKVKSRARREECTDDVLLEEFHLAENLARPQIVMQQRGGAEFCCEPTVTDDGDDQAGKKRMEDGGWRMARCGVASLVESVDREKHQTCQANFLFREQGQTDANSGTE